MADQIPIVNCSYQGHQNQPIINICVSPYCQLDRLQCKQCLDQNIHSVHQQSNQDNIKIIDLEKQLKFKKNMMNTAICDKILLQNKLKDLGFNIQEQIAQACKLLNEMIEVTLQHLQSIEIIQSIACRLQPSYLLDSQKFQQGWNFNNNFKETTEQFETIYEELLMSQQQFQKFTQKENDKFDQNYCENIKKQFMQLTYEYQFIRLHDYITEEIIKICNFYMDPTGVLIMCQFDKAQFKVYNIFSVEDCYEFELSQPFDILQHQVISFAIDKKGQNFFLGLTQGIFIKYIFKGDTKFQFDKDIKLGQEVYIQHISVYQDKYIVIHTQSDTLGILSLSDLSYLFKFSSISSGKFQINQSLGVIGLPILDGIHQQQIQQIYVQKIYIKNRQNQLNFSRNDDKVITYTKNESVAQIYKLNLNDKKSQMQLQQILNLENNTLCFNWAAQDRFIIQVYDRGYQIILLRNNDQNQRVKSILCQSASENLQNLNQFHFLGDQCQFVMEQYVNYIAIGKNRYYY
ncbi:hypothetical protein pb186bvf_002744 [Paramecium bursaria]